MTSTKILLVASLAFSLASCSAEAEIESSEELVTSGKQQIDSGIKPMDYIPPIGTGQSSAGNIKRERKFHIRYKKTAHAVFLFMSIFLFIASTHSHNEEKDKGYDH